MSDIVKCLGHYGFWGFSSSFDCLEALINAKVVPQTAGKDNGDEPIRVLLLHPGDIRHVLTTISQRRRHVKKGQKLRSVHFYIMEAPLEVTARNIMLLEILNDYEVPIRQRANVFLEVFGNSQVQVRTGRYLEQLGYDLRQLVVAGKGRLAQLVDLSLLRYKEKDDLEAIFKSYSRKEIFDIVSLRDHRLRGLYEERYDQRKAVCDWDYHYTIKPGASIIHIRLYKEWRMSGIAFEFGDQEYTEPNRTLMTYAEGTMKRGKDQGMLKGVKGFWGDVVVSPYMSFGIDCHTPGEFEEGLFEILNKDTGVEQHRHHAAEVSVFNLLSALWEIETGEVYRMARKNDIYSGLGTEAKALAPAQQPEKQLDSVVSGGTKVEGEEIVPDRLAADSDATTEGHPSSEADSVERMNESCRRFVIPEGTDFAPSDVWAGKVPGFAFKLGEEGQGYYRDVPTPDVPPPPQVAPAPADAPVTPAPPVAPVVSTEEIKAGADEVEMFKLLKRAESILETYKDCKVFPLGGTPEQTLGKSKFKGLFDMAFVSSRTVHLIEQPVFREMLKEKALVVAESAKFLCPLGKEARVGYEEKVTSYAKEAGLKKMNGPPVKMRYRDERDKADDKLFYVRG